MLMLLTNTVFADLYSESQSYAKDIVATNRQKIFSITEGQIPGYKGVDDLGYDNSSSIDASKTLALQDSEAGKFIIDSSAKRKLYSFSDEDPLIKSSASLTNNAMGNLAKSLAGEVKIMKQADKQEMHCEEAGASHLVACRYLLKPVPYYGERDCEEQHERALETCENNLVVTPVYEEINCEEPGHAIEYKTIVELVEKPHVKVNVPILRREYAVGIAHRPSTSHGREVNDCYATGGSWSNKVIGHQSLNPAIVVTHEEYRKAPVIERVIIDKKSSWRARRREMQCTGWSVTKTKDRALTMPDSMFTWTDSNLPHARDGAVCTKVSEKCLDASARLLYGVKVSKPCWRKEITYSCRYPSKNNCASLREQGCSQVGSTCLKMIDGKCVNYQQEMQCFKEFQDRWDGCDTMGARAMCSMLKADCVEGRSTKSIAGRDVTRDCWQQRQSYACSYPAENNCEALRLPKCKQVKESCQKMVNGTCVVMNRTYRCVDGVNDTWESNCHDLEKKALDGICERVTTKEGESETNPIDGFDYAAVYNKTHIFKCAYPAKNNCTALMVQGCKEKSKTCKRMESGTCVVWHKTFECITEGLEGKSLQGHRIRCLDGNCQGEQDINDSNIGEAVSQLAMLNSFKDSGAKDITTPTIFKGTSHTCRFSPLNYSNCCRMTGWGEAMNLMNCSSAEKQLAHFREKQYCVPVGTYCAKWAPAKAWCRERRNSYCCFKGKLQRILQVEGRKLLGIDWGNPKHPNCQGLSPDNLQKIDFSKLNLEEVYSDVLSSYKSHSQKDVAARLKKQILGSIGKGSYSRGDVTHG